MGAFKQLTTKDVVITPFDASKDWKFAGSEMTSSEFGIEIYHGQNITSSIYPGRPALEYTYTGYVYQYPKSLVYNNIKQLYYSNYISSSLGDNVPLPIEIPGARPGDDDRVIGKVEAPRYDNYLQSTLTQSRFFPTASNGELSVISIPSTLYGETIVPQTFNAQYTASNGSRFSIKDDGNGNILVDDVIEGQIFYPHGIVTFTSGSLQDIGKTIVGTDNLNGLKLNFSSNICIYEHQYNVV